MAENTQNQTLDETLNKTDFGHMINENKKPIMIAGAVIVVLVFVFSLYQQKSTAAYNENLEEAFRFKTSTIDAYNTKKMKADIFIKKISQMPKSIEGEPTLLPGVMLAATNLAKENNQAEAIFLLDRFSKHFSKGSYESFFISYKKSTLLEDLGKKQEAIKVLNSLKKGAVSLLKSRILLDMARMQISIKENEKAKANLNIILNDFKESEDAKMAKVYMAKISK